MVHVALTSLNKNYKEIKSTAESYNQITKKKAHHLLMILQTKTVLLTLK